MPLKPHVILLQEIPSTNDLAQLARKCFGLCGSFVAGLDCAILAAGEIQAVEGRFPPQHIQGIIRLQIGQENVGYQSEAGST
ncbi:MAG: hypothetical protein H7Y43_11840 [Akkermansiaceae bacterium]|nr:hypothetical protein [Verrucomicrobiales bacterium]